MLNKRHIPSWRVPAIVLDSALPDSEIKIDGEYSGTEVPGLAQIAKLATQGLDPIGAVNSFSAVDLQPDIHLREIGVAQELVYDDFRDLRSSYPLESSDTLEVFRALINRFVQRYSVIIRGSRRETVFISFAELHCPNRIGTLASLECQTDKTRQSGFDLKVLGVGGGSGMLFRLKIGVTLEARDGHCYAVQVPFELLIEECSYVRNNKRVGDFIRATVLNALPGLKQVLMTPHCPSCESTVEDSVSSGIVVTPYLLRAVCADESVQVEFEVSEDCSARAIMGLDVSPLGIKLDLGAEVKAFGSLRYRYKLPGGADYFAFRPKFHPFLYWRTAGI